MAKRKFRLYVSLVAVVVMAGAIMLYRQMGERSVESGTIEKSQTKESKTNRKGSGNRTVPVSVYVADYEKIDEGIRAVGTLLPFKEVEIASEIAGKVERIEFEEGVKVKRGSTIVKVNDEDLQSQLKRAVYQRDMLKEKLEIGRAHV